MTRLQAAVLEALRTILATNHDMPANDKFEAIYWLVQIAKPQEYDRHQVALRVMDMFPESRQVHHRINDIINLLAEE